ncbi:MAG: 8-amino-7-oxononanoate synthase [Planctomycetota bacterium]
MRVKVGGRWVVSFASNDYLGLSQHPRMISAAKGALDSFGTGATASALICGNKTIHDELARALAVFKGSDGALVFPSGFQAALATLGALADGETTVLLDKLSHACLIDGAMGSGVRMRTFHHNDVEDLTRLLEKESARRCIVVIESLYSMDGDVAPVEVIAKAAEKFGAIVLVDEAHATGVLGVDGRGCVKELLRGESLTIVMGTLSKALGAQGGFVCASERMIRAIVTGRAHMFSTALAPASAAAALEALALIDAEPELRARVAEHAECVRGELKRLGIATPSTEGPIVPAIVGDEVRALALSERLLERGYFVPAVRYPTVKKGEARLRISVSAAHTQEDCVGLMRAVEDGW